MIDLSTDDTAAELDRLKFALHSAQIGTWTLDIPRQQVWWDARCKELYGFGQHDVVPYDQVLSYMHEEDRQRVDQAVQWALDPQSGGHYEVQFRTVGADDGQIRWLLCRGRADFDAHGKALRFAGTAQDITPQVLAQQALQQSEVRFQNLVRQANVGMNVLLGQELRVTVVNEAYGRIIGHRLEEMQNRPLFELIPDAENYFRPLLEQVMATGEPLAQQEVPYRLRSASGQLIEGFIDYLYQPYREADGRITGVTTVVNDVTQLVNSRQTIAQSEAKLRALIQEAPVATCLFVGRELRVELANPMMLNVWGKDQSVLGKPLVEAVPELKGQPFLAILDEVFTSGQAYRSRDARAELAVDGVLGTYYFDFTYKPLFDAAGEVYAIMDMAVDVTQPVINRLELAKQKTHLQNAIDIGDLGTFDIDVPNQTASFSERLGRWFNLMPPTQPVAHFLANVHGDDQAMVARALDESVRDERQSRHDITYRIVDGQGTTTHYLRSIGEAQFMDGQPRSISGMIQDVTEQVEARQKLEESEARFRHIVQQSPAATLVLRGEALVIDQINQPMLSFMGRGEEVIGQPLVAAVPELDGQAILQQARRVYSEGVDFDGYEVLIPHARTGVRQDYYYDLSYRPLKENGQRTGVIQVVTDVTAQVRVRQQVEQSEQQLRQLIEHSPVAVGLLVGRDLVVERVNDSILALWGKDRSVIGKPLAEALPELVGQPFLPILDEVYTTGRPYHTSNDRAELASNGGLRTYYLAFSYTPLRNAAQQVYAILITATDVTEMVQSRQTIEIAQQELLRVNQRLSLALDAGRLGAYTLDLATGNMALSEQCRANYGQAAQTPFNFPDLIATIVDDDREPVQQAVTRAVETQTMYTAEYRIVWPDGTQHWVKASGQPEYGADGQPVRITGVTQEITAQRLMQEELERQVEQRTRQLQASVTDLRRSNENLEQFAYIASHDLQEPLRKIQQFGDLLKTRFADSLDGQALGYLDRMQVAAGRMSVLIKDLLAFSRISTTQAIAQPVMLNGVVSGVLESLSVAIEESGAQLEVDELPTVQGDRLQLSQLFQNLLANALKFRRTSPEGTLLIPQISVRSRRLANEELPASVKPTRDADQYYLIEVTDNGIGFEEKYVDRIFQVFQRLHGKNEFAGTGVGLAIVQKVVTNHGGAITARGKPDQGATFCVYLPI